MNPIWRQMKKRNPSSGQNGQLVHWWLLIHSGNLTLGLAARVYRDGLTVDKTSGGEQVLHWDFHCCEKLHTPETIKSTLQISYFTLQT
jgi:hypothetical protein